MVVDTAALWEHVDKESLDARIVMTKLEIANNESKLNNYLSTTRLTPFARWSTYWQSNDKFSHNGDVGIRFTVPIYNETQERERHWRHRKRLS